MTTFQIVQISLDAVIILLGLYFAFLKSYFQEKGKNQATKEDIAEITKKVEEVKNSFLHETEKLKLDLQVSKELKLSIKTEEKNSVLQCYKSYHVWYAYLTGFNPIKYDTLKSLREDMEKMDELHKSFLEAKAMMELYVEYTQIDMMATMLNSFTRDFMHDVNSCCYSYEVLLQKAERNEFRDKQEEIDAKKVVLQQLLNVNAENETKLNPKFREFKKSVYKYISKMVNN